MLRRTWLVTLTVVGLAGLAIWLVPHDPASPPVATPPAPSAAGVAAVRAAAAQPAQLRIPSIGVRSPLVDLRRLADGTLEVPTDYQVAGWYAGGPSPGDAGGPPAVIAGHVDSATGPAVFFRLRELKKGSKIEVSGIDGAVRTFTVYRLADYPKNTFPSGEVYAASARAELRLITCSGDFDQAAGAYRDNLVAYATLDGGPR
ncbi:class F sortase [Asanoa iriomotensis]|uniref:class F sortase n=1 Tax=Asanoa iriomotensis TaxID=234613 RepID=UPI0019446AB5|nr:class F sortase [Asanoa iriomotensis]